MIDYEGIIMYSEYSNPRVYWIQIGERSPVINSNIGQLKKFKLIMVLPLGKCINLNKSSIKKMTFNYGASFHLIWCCVLYVNFF